MRGVLARERVLVGHAFGVVAVLEWSGGAEHEHVAARAFAGLAGESHRELAQLRGAALESGRREGTGVRTERRRRQRIRAGQQ